MLELSILDFVFIIFGAVALIIWMILFIKGNKYNSMFEVLSENEFRLKDIYGMGYAVLEMIGYNYKSKKDRKLRQELDVLYGEKYSESYSLIRLNMDEAVVPESFGERAIGIGGDMAKAIADIRGLV